MLAFHRRFHDLALIAVQRFRFDIVPLALLLAIAVTGLALTADSTFFGGAYYWFISLTHAAIVVMWLISLPFGKFFHIIERPATVGIELYWRTGEDSQQHTCPRCGTAFAPARFVRDLKRTLYDIGEQYTVRQAPHADAHAQTRIDAHAQAQMVARSPPRGGDGRRVVAGFLPGVQACHARAGEPGGARPRWEPIPVKTSNAPSGAAQRVGPRSDAPLGESSARGQASHER